MSQHTVLGTKQIVNMVTSVKARDRSLTRVPPDWMGGAATLRFAHPQVVECVSSAKVLQLKDMVLSERLKVRALLTAKAASALVFVRTSRLSRGLE